MYNPPPPANNPAMSPAMSGVQESPPPPPQGCGPSGVAWSAIIAGALAAAALSLIFLFLGSGLGLAMVSPWSQPSSHLGVSAAAFTFGTAIWLLLMHMAASSVGGYLTGRLRGRWHNAHADEVYFRDTAHGMLSWALATVLSAALLVSAASMVVGNGMKAATALSGGVLAGTGYNMAQNQAGGEVEDSTDPLGSSYNYLIDNLFRSDSNAPPQNDAGQKDFHAETARILGMAMLQGNLEPADRGYLSQSIAARANISVEQANKRLDALLAKLNSLRDQAKQTMDAARRAAMQAALGMFLALLVGAFMASYAALCGGRHRDKV